MVAVPTGTSASQLLSDLPDSGGQAEKKPHEPTTSGQGVVVVEVLTQTTFRAHRVPSSSYIQGTGQLCLGGLFLSLALSPDVVCVWHHSLYCFFSNTEVNLSASGER